MSLIRWVKSWLSHRGKALASYRAGMAKAARHDYGGAIADYSAAIEAEETPLDVKAMAFYNRALAYSATGQDEKAAEDLEAVLKMPGLSERVRAAAQNRQQRIRRRQEGGDKRGE